jgi:hypothetical protein
VAGVGLVLMPASPARRGQGSAERLVSGVMRLVYGRVPLLPAGSKDACMCCFLFVCVPTRKGHQRVAAEIHRVLRPGGRGAVLGTRPESIGVARYDGGTTEPCPYRDGHPSAAGCRAQMARRTKSPTSTGPHTPTAKFSPTPASHHVHARSITSHPTARPDQRRQNDLSCRCARSTPGMRGYGDVVVGVAFAGPRVDGARRTPAVRRRRLTLVRLTPWVMAREAAVAPLR